MKCTPLSGSDGKHQGELVECPACGYGHFFRTVAHENLPVWSFNGDRERPTFAPSMLVNANLHKQNPSAILCHSFVREGRIEFLSDCSHAMAGQTVDLPEVE